MNVAEDPFRTDIIGSTGIIPRYSIPVEEKKRTR